MTRVACVLVPLFPLAARLRAEPELLDQPVAVCEGNGSAARIAAASRPARRHGVRAGMTLAQARGILPDLVARGRDPGCERSAHEALLEVASGLSPRVEDAAPDIAFADVSGMEKLFPDERGLAAEAGLAAHHLDLPVRVGLAATKLAARLAAQQPDPPTVVPPGGEAVFLAPLPLAHLGLEPRLAATLSRWGVTTLGELARLPADRVASRLGPSGIRAHRAARGIDPEPVVPHPPPPTLGEGLELEWPVVTVDPLLAALRQALERLARRLEPQGLACTLLELELTLEPEGDDHRGIRLPAPTRDVDTLLGLLRLEVEARPPRAPVAGFQVAVHPDRPRQGQLTLFGPPEISPDRLAATLGRLAARLGPDRVGSPRPVDGHLPERAASVAFAPPPPPRLRRGPRQGRGLLATRVLRPPVRLEVIVEEAPGAAGPPGGGVSEVPPPAFGAAAPRLASVASVRDAAPRIQGLVRVAAGPWRLEDGWWSEEPVRRDYWDVELSGGGLYRIFRDRSSGEWYADGMYD